MNKCIWILLIGLVVVSSCKKEESQADIEDQADIDEALIQDYLTTNNITEAIRTEFGVYYLIDSVGDGSGLFPNGASTVRVHYRGYLLDGTEFDAGNFDDIPLNFILPSTIAGWQIGMPYFEKGSKGRLFIPSFYGYGTQTLSNIPANSVLLFDVKLVNVFN